MVIRANGPVVIQMSILVAIVCGVFQVGRVAERAETRLSAIEAGVGELKASVEANGSGVQGLSGRVNAIDEHGTRWATKAATALIARIEVLESCGRRGKRKCP